MYNIESNIIEVWEKVGFPACLVPSLPCIVVENVAALLQRHLCTHTHTQKKRKILNELA